MLIICSDDADLHSINFDNLAVTGVANLFIHDYHYDEKPPTTSAKFWDYHYDEKRLTTSAEFWGYYDIITNS